jgi:hypothetical protein
MIIKKEEFTAGAFDLPYVKIYSTLTNTLKDKKTGKTHTATFEKPLIVEKRKFEDMEESL